MVHLFPSNSGAISLEHINYALVFIDGTKSKITSSIFYDMVIGFKALKRLVGQQEKDAAEFLIKWTAMYLNVQCFIDPENFALRHDFETSVPPALFYLISSMKYTTKDLVINELIVMARKVLANVQPITIERLANFNIGLISSIFESLNCVGDFITQTLLLRLLFTISRCIHSQRVQEELEAQSMDDHNFKTKFTAAMNAANFQFENHARDFLNYVNMSFIKTPSIFSFRCEVLCFGNEFQFFKHVTATHFWVDLNLLCCMLTFQADYKPPQQSFVHVTGNIKVSKMKLQKTHLIIEFMPPVQFSKRFPNVADINRMKTVIAQLPIDEALRIQSNHVLNYFNTPQVDREVDAAPDNCRNYNAASVERDTHIGHDARKESPISKSVETVPTSDEAATDRDETMRETDLKATDDNLQESLLGATQMPNMPVLEDSITTRLRNPCFVNTRRGNAIKRCYEPTVQKVSTRRELTYTSTPKSGKSVACEQNNSFENFAAPIAMKNPRRPKRKSEGLPAKTKQQRNRELKENIGAARKREIASSDFDDESVFNYLRIQKRHPKMNQPSELETSHISIQDAPGDSQEMDRNRELKTNIGGATPAASEMNISSSDFDDQSVFNYLTTPRSQRSNPFPGDHQENVLQKTAPTNLGGATPASSKIDISSSGFNDQSMLNCLKIPRRHTNQPTELETSHISIQDTPGEHQDKVLENYEPTVQKVSTRRELTYTSTPKSGKSVACEQNNSFENFAAPIAMKNPHRPKRKSEGLPAKTKQQRNRELKENIGAARIREIDFDDESVFNYLRIPKRHPKMNQPTELETSNISIQDAPGDSQEMDRNRELKTNPGGTTAAASKMAISCADFPKRRAKQPTELKTSNVSVQPPPGDHQDKVLQKTAATKIKRRVARKKRLVKRTFHYKLTDNSFISFTSDDDAPSNSKKRCIYSYEIDLETQDIRSKSELHNTISISPDHSNDSGRMQEKNVYRYELLSEEEFRLTHIPHDSRISSSSSIDHCFEGANDSTTSSNTTGFDHLPRATRRRRGKGRKKRVPERGPTVPDDSTVPEARNDEAVDQIFSSIAILPELERTFNTDRADELDSCNESLTSLSSASKDSWLTKLRDAYTNLERKYEEEAREHLRDYCNEPENEDHKDFYTKAYHVVKRFADEHRNFITANEKLVSSALAGKFNELPEYIAAITRFQKLKKNTIRALRTLANYNIELRVREVNRNKLQAFGQIEKNIRHMEFRNLLSQHLYKYK